MTNNNRANTHTWIDTLTKLILAILALLAFFGIVQWADLFSNEEDTTNQEDNSEHLTSDGPSDSESNTGEILSAGGNFIISGSGEEILSLSENQVLIGTADKFQDVLDQENPPFTIFVIEGPLQETLKLWWGGGDYWTNASETHIQTKIQEKIEDIKRDHPSDYQSRGYRVIRCVSTITNCNIIEEVHQP